MRSIRKKNPPTNNKPRGYAFGGVVNSNVARLNEQERQRAAALKAQGFESGLQPALSSDSDRASNIARANANLKASTQMSLGKNPFNKEPTKQDVLRQLRQVGPQYRPESVMEHQNSAGANPGQDSLLSAIRRNKNIRLQEQSGGAGYIDPITGELKVTGQAYTPVEPNPTQSVEERAEQAQQRAQYESPTMSEEERAEQAQQLAVEQ